MFGRLTFHLSKQDYLRAETIADSMTTGSILERFEGDQGRRRLLELLQAQVIVSGDITIAQDIAGVGELQELSTGDILIRQGHTDNDVFFILSGALRVLVNGREVAVRHARQHVGEMAIIDPSSRRTATVIASEQSVVLKVADGSFSDLANRHTQVWCAIARELCHRLDERKKFHRQPNSKAILFMGSSTEQLPITEALAESIPKEIADVIIWSKGVFEASNFALDDLETQLKVADFSVLVAGADDQVISRGKTGNAPRDNIIFELGLFMGALTRTRTFLLVPDGLDIKIPTDLLGLNCLRFRADLPISSQIIGPVADVLVAIITQKGPK